MRLYPRQCKRTVARTLVGSAAKYNCDNASERTLFALPFYPRIIPRKERPGGHGGPALGAAGCERAPLLLHRRRSRRLLQLPPSAQCEREFVNLSARADARPVFFSDGGYSILSAANASLVGSAGEESLLCPAERHLPPCRRWCVLERLLVAAGFSTLSP